MRALMTVPCAAVGDAPARSLQLSRGLTGTSASPTYPALPPVAGKFVLDYSCRDLDVSEVAELPELFGRPGVLKDEFVDFEGVEFTGLEAIEREPDVTDELAQLFLVIRRHRLASGPTI